MVDSGNSPLEHTSFMSEPGLRREAGEGSQPLFELPMDQLAEQPSGQVNPRWPLCCTVTDSVVLGWKRLGILSFISNTKHGPLVMVHSYFASDLCFFLLNM